MSDKDLNLAPAIGDLADKVKADAEKDREVLKYELTIVSLNEPIDPAIKATAKDVVDKIIRNIDPKSHGQHAEHYIEMIKLYYTSAINTLANGYQELINANPANKANIIENFANHANSQKNMAIAQIAFVTKENGGWLGDEGIVALHKASMKFHEIVRAEDNKDLVKAFAYTLKSNPKDRDPALKGLENIIRDLYGPNINDASKESTLFILANLTHNDRQQLLTDLKKGQSENKIFDYLTFAKDANAKGALTLSEMEFFLDKTNFTDEERQKYNETYLKARASLVDTRGLKGGYGDQALLDSVTPGSIALFLADAVAVSSFALNAGFAIGSGNPMDIFQNTWTRLPAAWMIGRHMQAKDEPISVQLRGKKDTEAVRGEKALLTLNTLQNSTLAFEKWEPFLTDRDKSTPRIEHLQAFLHKFMKDQTLNEVPDKIAPQLLINFLKSKPEYAETLTALLPILENPSAGTPETLAKVLYTIHHSRLENKSTSGLRSADEFEKALAASQEKL